MYVEELSGIWTFGVRDIHRESDWIYHSSNLLVETIHQLLTGRGVAIRRKPRTLGFNTYGFNLAGDLAQCLRYARGEAEMTPEYVEQTVDAFATILSVNVLDLATSKENLIPGALPAPAFDWKRLQDRPLCQILQGAQARKLLEKQQPIPSHAAAALTGMSVHALSRFKDGDLKMTSKKIDGVVHYNPEVIDVIVQSIEELFFSYDTYNPL